jgi:O-antigen ligase
MSDLTPSGEASLKDLIASAVADLQRLIKAQLALAKLELQQSGRAAGKTSVLLLGALSMAAMGGIFLLVTLAYVLVAIGLPVWAGFGIVTLVLFIVAAILGLLGRKAAQQIRGPERTAAEIEKTKAALQSAVEGAEPPSLPER